jgi:beta-lactamase class A
MALRLFLIVAFPLMLASTAIAQRDIVSLRKDLTGILSSFDGVAGIAVKHSSLKDTLTINGERRFPMQSVYKFHLGLAVLSRVDKGEFTLDQKIRISKNDYWKKTWSPIMKKYPEGGIDLPLHEVVRYTVRESDNVGCDVLFRLVGGPSEVEKFIHSLGINGIAIRNTEREMHISPTFNTTTRPFHRPC